MTTYKQDFNYQIPASIMFYDDPSIGWKEKLIYSYIASLAHNSNECFATNEHIASKFKCSIRVVQRVIKQLANTNLITIKENYKYKSQRIIYINPLQRDDTSNTPGVTDVTPQGDKTDIQGCQSSHTGMAESSCMGDKTDTHIINRNNSSNTTNNYASSPSAYPNLEQVMEYANYLDEQGEEIFFNPREFYDKYEINGWTDSQGNTIYNWKRVFDKWVENNKDNAEVYGSHNLPYKDFETPKQRIKRKTAFIRDFKAKHKNFKCYSCGAETESDIIDEDSGFYHCSVCGYAINILEVEHFK